MGNIRFSSLVHGVVGGLIAGLVVALWFFVVDVATAGAFHTPAVLAGAVLGRDVAEPTLRLVVTFTLLHFAVFTFLGLITGALIQSLDLHPGFLLAVVFGLGLLDAVHYGALLVTGARVLTLLPTYHVLAANLLGSMAMMAYLHRALGDREPLGLGVLRLHPFLGRSLVAGVLGAAAVAFWFLIIDTVAGRPFFTPAALGSIAFLGAQSPAEIQLSAGVIAAYTVLHLMAFALVGVCVVWAAERLERTPGVWLILFMSFVVLEGVFIGIVGAVSNPILDTIGWWAVLSGNLIAILTMGLWVWKTHPGLQRQFRAMHVETKV
jgi:hypothetical protein